MQVAWQLVLSRNKEITPDWVFTASDDAWKDTQQISFATKKIKTLAPAWQPAQLTSTHQQSLHCKVPICYIGKGVKKPCLPTNTFKPPKLIRSSPLKQEIAHSLLWEHLQLDWKEESVFYNWPETCSYLALQNHVLQLTGKISIGGILVVTYL